MASEKEKLAAARERIKALPKDYRQALFSDLEAMDDLSSEKVRALNAKISEMEAAAKRAASKGGETDPEDEDGPDTLGDFLKTL